MYLGVEKHLVLAKNPDPEAYIDFSLVYEPMEEVEADEMSVLNVSNLNMSTVEMG